MGRTGRRRTWPRSPALLERVGLAHLTPRLAETADWDKALTEAERRRLAFARLHALKPDIVLIDDGLHGLPEPDQAALFADLRAALPGAVMVTSGSGAVLEAAADLVLVRQGGALQSASAKAAAPARRAEPPAQGLNHRSFVNRHDRRRSEPDLNTWDVYWGLRVSECPCDVHFVEWLEENGVTGRTIYHMGSGGHHYVGVRCAEPELDNRVLSITASTPSTRPSSSSPRSSRRCCTTTPAISATSTPRTPTSCRPSTWSRCSTPASSATRRTTPTAR